MNPRERRGEGDKSMRGAEDRSLAQSGNEKAEQQQQQQSVRCGLERERKRMVPQDFMPDMKVFVLRSHSENRNMLLKQHIPLSNPVGPPCPI